MRPEADVSVVIPVRDGERYLADAVDSVLAQTVPRCEIIVVDDGSQDGTGDIIRAYGDRIRSLRQERSGVSAARNYGLRLARGSWIAFLDADDRLHPQKLERQLGTVRERDLSFCDCHTQWFWSDDMSAHERSVDYRFAHPFWRQVLPGHISTWLVRRDLCERVGRFDVALDYSEDSDWYVRLRVLDPPRVTLPDVLTYRRLHRGNATASNPQAQVQGLARVVKAALERRRGKAE